MMSGYYVEESTNEKPIKIKQRMTTFNRMGLSYLSQIKARAEKRGDLEEANGALAEIERRKNSKLARANLLVEKMKKKIDTTNTQLEEIHSIVPELQPPSVPSATKKQRKPRKQRTVDFPVPVVSNDALVDDITMLKERIHSYLEEHPLLKNMGASINLQLSCNTF